MCYTYTARYEPCGHHILSPQRCDMPHICPLYSVPPKEWPVEGPGLPADTPCPHAVCMRASRISPEETQRRDDMYFWRDWDASRERREAEPFIRARLAEHRARWQAERERQQVERERQYEMYLREVARRRSLEEQERWARR